jgi:RNA polymerase sigma-70 factor (ECF subfamily)
MPPIDPRSSDAELLVRSEADGGAFGELYERHAPAILAFHFRRTGCPHTAADLTAETFAEAFASRRRFVDVGAPGRAWLFAIAHRQLARFARREAVSRRYRDRLRLEPIRLTDDDLDRIDDLFDSASLRTAVTAAMEHLPAGQAEALRLRIAMDLPYAEVARRLGCTEGAARVRVSRALAQLADDLEAT